MSPNIFADHFCRHFVTHGSGEVAVFPQLAAPQLSLDSGELSEHGTRGKTLEPRHDLCDGVARRERTEDMHVIGADFHLFYGDVVAVGNLCEHFRDSRCDRTLKDSFAVLRRPDQVICRVVSGVRGSSKDHARILLNLR